MDLAAQVRLICITTARVTGQSDDPTGGDSGAPVIEPDDDDDNEVELLGTLLGGGTGDQSDEFDFSTIGNIYSELGLYSTWDSCVSGC